MAAKQVEEEVSVAVSAENAKPLEYVDEERFYFMDLQFGAKASWRAWQGQSRKVVPKADGGFDHVHNPKVILKAGPFPGSIVNGVIASHNDWIKFHNRRKDSDYRGQLDRQVLVLKVKETESIPEGFRSHQGMVPISMVERIAKSIVAEELEATIGSK